MSAILWVVAVVIGLIGIVQLLQGEILFGLLLLVIAAAVGPGGWSVFSRRGA